MKVTPEMMAQALAGTDWARVDETTDADIARQIAADPDTAPEMKNALQLLRKNLITIFTPVLPVTVQQVAGVVLQPNVLAPVLEGEFSLCPLFLF
ncbi:hypothetical protein [Roseomonas mucosa]|uniref:hypothetical protein n=1 Tax=Roseomonas mucosa TaxID=207340 RepID=UPI0028CC3A4D|nr:hypothetical protein [Roseomonas mucosa]MDT8351890.1 hypothetical protein [Roseomonas mucosa]